MKMYYMFFKWIFVVIICVIMCFFISSIKLDSNFHGGYIIYHKDDNFFEESSYQEIVKIITQFLHIEDTVNKDINTHVLEELILRNKYVDKAEVYLDLEIIFSFFTYVFLYAPPAS